jgi:hypothetical protein
MICLRVDVIGSFEELRVRVARAAAPGCMGVIDAGSMIGRASASAPPSQLGEHPFLGGVRCSKVGFGGGNWEMGNRGGYRRFGTQAQEVLAAWHPQEMDALLDADLVTTPTLYERALSTLARHGYAVEYDESSPGVKVTK